jgi:hypothetical protein
MKISSVGAVLAVAGVLASFACSDDSSSDTVGTGATGGSGSGATGGQAGASGSSGSSGSAGTDAGSDAPSSAPRHFRRITLSTEFLCEGANFGDFDGDGVTDVVAGPYWYAGPEFTQAHAIYPPPDPLPNPAGEYSDNFFAFVHDLDADGDQDVLFVGFPGGFPNDPTNGYWYENPGTPGTLWTLHDVLDLVENESPDFTDLTGDGKPELVFNTGGRLGWAAPDWANPAAPWTFHPLSPVGGPYWAFTHGLGIGDLNGDGRRDVLEVTGYYLQPDSLASDPVWPRQVQSFGEGGAQMFTDDVDGDGDADIVTSLEAHHSGLAWFEQRNESGAVTFTEHEIVARKPTGDAIIHEPHALTLHDVDGDGDRDIVTGERFWGHYPGGNVSIDDPARIYWFELVRSGGTVEYRLHQVDDNSGVGTQVVVGDVTADGLPDIVTANKKGAFVLVQELGD